MFQLLELPAETEKLETYQLLLITKRKILLQSIYNSSSSLDIVDNATLFHQVRIATAQKGDANDGKPDAFRISKSEKVKIWLEFQYYGWFGMDFENIQAEPPKEARGQS